MNHISEKSIRILGIAPYEGMQILMQKVVQNYPEIDLNAMIGDLDYGVELAEKNFHSDYDIIISRGGTAQLLRKKINLPVVEIPITEYDILRVLKLVENVSNSFAIVGFPNITEHVYHLSEMLSVEPEIFTINQPEDVEQVIQTVWEKGYRTVLCDVVATIAAKQHGMNAMLITSGTESIKKAYHDAILLYKSLKGLKTENNFLRQIIHGQANETIVFDENENLFFSTLKAENSSSIISMLREELNSFSDSDTIRINKSLDGMLYSIKAQHYYMNECCYTIFHYTKSKIPFSSSRSGIHYYSNKQAKQSFYNSFYSSAGDLFGIEDSIRMVNLSDKPVMLTGEEGTGKESFATILYSRSALHNHPFISINCALLNQKSWEYLLTNHNSPFTDSQTTIYLSQLDVLPIEKQKQLLAVIEDMDICKRNRVIFSYTCLPNGNTSEAGSIFSDTLCCLYFKLPSLRELKKQIPAITHLYLSQLTSTQITDVISIDKAAIKKLQEFSWPHNLSQFKRVMQELVVTTAHSCITAEDVSSILSSETAFPITDSTVSAPARFDLNRTLEEMELDIVNRILEECNGNQTEAAKRLGISRTTLWRCLNKGKKSD